MYYTYIIYSPILDRYYIGQCQDIEARLSDHNNSRSTYTKPGKPWVLKWKIAFLSRRDAIAEEARLKNKKSRKYIEPVIALTTL